MNAHRYRLVFNRARGALMAVAETATAHGQERSNPAMPPPVSNPLPDPPAARRPRRPLAWALLLTFSAQCVVPPALAQIVAYRSAPASQRPTVLSAGNGIPLINIQTPSAAGVSRNTYEQFDIAAQGAILNNSRTNVQTQLGGWVQGNPWLATGGARVILNEVISANPSQLLGYVEVAGNPAQVVIANPAGVTCNGCGFINASRATLTTGTPILNGGNLDGYRVEGGTIRVEGAGLDASRAGYTDLIARAVEVNAGIWAQSLQVTAGANVVSADNVSATPIGGSGGSPAFAIDVAQLGGMYAGKIVLVGTEAGVGVRNAGQIGAGVGEVVVTVDGQLVNTAGQIVAGTGLALTAAGLNNAGGTFGTVAGPLSAHLAGTLDNTAGILHAGGALAVTADTLANERGSLTGADHVTLSVRQLGNRQGTIESAGDLTLGAGGTVDNAGGTFIAGRALSIDAAALTGSGRLLAHGDLALRLAGPYANISELTAGGNLRLETTGAFNNQALIQANGAFDFAATTLDNAATGQIIATDLHLAAGTLTNRGLIDGQNVRLDAGTLNNLGAGRLYGDILAIAADTLNNAAEGGTAPVIAARDRLDFGVGTLNNGEGALIFSAGDLAIGGGLDAGGRATGQANALVNTSATIEALGNLTIDTASLTNEKARFATGRESSVDLPTGADLLAYTPEIGFHWPIGESNATTWRNYIRDRYLNVIAKLLGGGPPADWVAMYNPPADPNADPNAPPDPDAAAQYAILLDLFNRSTGFANVWGDLTGYSGPIGGGLSDAYRAELAAAVNARPVATFQDSLTLWNFLIAKINADRPEVIATLAQSLAGRSFPLTSYNQHCRDIGDDCSYVDESVITRSDSRDVVTADSANGIIRAGGRAAIAADTLTNRYSFIQSGGDLQLTGTTLTNIGAELYRYSDTTTETTLWHWANRYHGTTVSAGSTQTLIGGAPGVISAGGALTGSYTGLIDNQTIRENTAPVTPPGNATPGALTLAPIGPPAGNSLLRTHPDPNARYLVETDPRFASYRQWLSSDYMLQALAYDPATTQKRLGDGFYEQRLITEQVAQLTGRRFLEGYANDEAQYRALMDAGLTLAQDWPLIPGVALTAAQMVALTSDIVWLVEQSVTLADGSTQRVLVPRVYVRVREGDLAPSGALIAAETLRLETTGDLVTSGTLAGRQVVSLAAENLANRRGRIVGQEVQAQATNDVTILGGTVEAERSLSVSAGRDLTIASSTVDREYQIAGTGFTGSVNTTVIDRVAGLYVSGTGGVLIASAGNDLNLLGAAVVNAGSADAAPGSTTLMAGHDLNLGTVTESHTASTQGRYGGSRTRWNEAAYGEVGSFILSQGDLTLLAGNDLTARAATAISDGALMASAGRDLTITTGEAGYAMDFYRKSSKSRSANGTTVSKSASVTQQAVSSTTALSSTFGGDSVILQAGRDMRITGSAVTAENALTIAAGGDVLLDSAESTRESHFRRSTSKSQGLGNKSETRTRDTLSVRQTGTTLSGGTIDVTAGGDLTLVASHVKATGDITFTAGGEIAYLAAAEFEETRSSHKKKNNLLGFEMLYDNNWQKNKQKSETTKSSRTAAVTRIETPGTVLSVSGDDTTLAGTRVRAGEFIAVAGMNGDAIDPTARIHLLGVKESESFSETKEGSSKMWQSSQGEGHTTETLVLPDFQVYGATENAPRIGAPVDTPRVDAWGLLGGNAPAGGATEPAPGEGPAVGETPAATAMPVTSQVASLSPTLIAPGGIVVGAIDLPATQAEADRAGQGNGGGKPPPTVTLDLKAQAKTLAEQPGLAWLGELAEREDVDWQRVALIHDQWDYKHSGLTQEGAIVIAIIVTILTWGVAAEAGAAVATEAGMTTTVVVDGIATTTLTTAGTAAATATAAGLTTLASQAAVSLVNNQGDIGETLKDLGSDESVKQVLMAMLTAGALNAVGGTEWMKPFKNTGLTDRLVTQMVNATVSATIYTAIEGGSYAETLEDALLAGGVNAVAGWAARGIGDWYDQSDLAGKYLAHKVAHALLGCAGAEAKGGSCASGAIGGAVGEAFAELYGDMGGTTATEVDRNRLVQLSSLVAMAAAKASGKDIYAAGDAAAIAVVNNYLFHQEAKALADAKERRQQCPDKACADTVDLEIKAWEDLDRFRNTELKTACQNMANPDCSKAMQKLADAVASYEGKTDGWDAYGIVGRERSEATSLANQYTIKATRAAEVLRSVSDLTLDLSPAGDIKALLEAKTKLDYALALVGALGPAGDAAKALIKEAKILAEAGQGVKAAEKLNEAERTIAASAGSKGNWDKTINGQLEPKTIYQLDNGHKYMTDGSGRVAAVEGDLSLTAMDRNLYQQCAAGKCGNIGDDGGHLIASSLGGAGDRINIVPQASTLNRGDWKAMENELRTALRDGKSVSVKIDVGYPAGGGLRPSEFVVNAFIDGERIVKRFYQ